VQAQEVALVGLLHGGQKGVAAQVDRTRHRLIDQGLADHAVASVSALHAQTSAVPDARFGFIDAYRADHPFGHAAVMRHGNDRNRLKVFFVAVLSR